jgi:hypothetical protein
MADLVTIAEFLERSEAIVARAFLDSEGVKSLLPEDNVMSTMPQLIHAGGGYRLMVRVEDAARAKRLLQDVQTVRDSQDA